MSDPRKAVHHELTADSFLELLSPISGLFPNDSLPGRWVFRGLGNSNYALLPSAYRPGTVFQKGSSTLTVPCTNTAAQIEAELKTIMAFLEAVNRQGHSIPGYSLEVKEMMEELARSISMSKFNNATIEVWPPTCFLSILGLAQHYGVPTRMLDWSTNPYIAAYFAAISGAKSPMQEGKICVWAFTKEDEEFDRIFSEDSDRYSELPIKWVAIPSYGNDNLKAQKGVFLVHQQRDKNLSSDFAYMPYDDLLLENLKSHKDSTTPILYQLTLPHSEAPQLLKQLATMGIDGATIFPGIEGAKRALDERRLWPSNSESVNRRSPKVMGLLNYFGFKPNDMDG